MFSDMKSQFIFVVCQVGAEKALKDEIPREHPDLRFAFSRPGFVTFKQTKTYEAVFPDFKLHSVFARAYGLSLGKTSPSKTIELQSLIQKAVEAGTKLRLHVWDRDRYIPGDEPQGYTNEAEIKQFSESIRKLEPDFFYDDPVAQPGDPVLDFILLDKDEWWVGCHRHSPSHSPYPGGKPNLPMPEGAPSRAYLKMEEGLLWSGAPVNTGDVAVEIGSAPGGAVLALLERGLFVVGIDPAEMDATISQRFPDRFMHIRRGVNSVYREELPPSVQWLALDMNVPPHISIPIVERLVSQLQDSLLGVLLTVKMNEWKLAQNIPRILKQVKAMGMVYIRATQLSKNRQEIFIYGLTKHGLNRKPQHF